MNWLSFSKKFHPSWHKHIKPFIESAECDLIFSHLKSRSNMGHKIMPISHNTFKAFEIPMEEIKVVILGGSPYNGIADGVTIANGLFLDCSHIAVPSYELRNFYRGIEIEIYNGLSLQYRDTQSIDYLTQQGVMMLNASLTTEEHTNHEEVWESFINHVMKILDSLNIPIIFIGELAKSYSNLISNQWKITELDDIPGGPGQVWDTQGTFRKIDDVLEELNKDTVMWLNIDVPF